MKPKPVQPAEPAKREICSGRPTAGAAGTAETAETAGIAEIAELGALSGLAGLTGLAAPALSLIAALALAFSASPTLAQYKVVAPDGSVTYTDRPPAQSNLRVTPMGRNAPPPVPGLEVGLPLELRQALARYPVTLYTAADCPPCSLSVFL